MHYELYVDRLFFTWFCMHLLLLVLTAAAGKLKLVRWRAVTAAGGGSLFFLVVFLMPLGDGGLAAAGKVLLQSAGVLVMIRAAFALREPVAWLRAGTVFGICAVLTGGVLTAICRNRVTNVFDLLGISALLTAAGTAVAAREWNRRRRPCYTVVLREGGCSVKLRALSDSGNSLTEPISKRPVSVVHTSVISKLGLREKQERFRVVPYHSVGKEHGLMNAWMVEEMEIHTEGQRRIIYGAVLAEYEHMPEDRDYRMLMHPALLMEEKGDNHDFESSNAGNDAV